MRPGAMPRELAESNSPPQFPLAAAPGVNGVMRKTCRWLHLRPIAGTVFSSDADNGVSLTTVYRAVALNAGRTVGGSQGRKP